MNINDRKAWLINYGMQEDSVVVNVLVNLCEGRFLKTFYSLLLIKMVRIIQCGKEERPLKIIVFGVVRSFLDGAQKFIRETSLFAKNVKRLVVNCIRTIFLIGRYIWKNDLILKMG